MSKHLERAILLIEQSRWDLAEDELRQALSADPDSGLGHVYLAVCLSAKDNLHDATDEAHAAIRLAPDLPFAHHVVANIYLKRNRYQEAERAIREALRLDPTDAEHYALLANIFINSRSWQPALEAALQGLEQDAEHIGCNNFRAIALTKLGRTGEAAATVAETLGNDPENAFSHANLGWNFLHEHNTQKALEHFREALRIDPEMDYAKLGMVEALKSRNIIYGLMLRYFLWMGRLSGGKQWMVVLGLYIGYRFLDSLAENKPHLKSWIQPWLYAYIAFAVMTWISAPLFNLLLRLNKYGRHALSQDQRLASTCIGLLLIPTVIALVLWAATGVSLAQVAALYFGFLLLPTSAIFTCDKGWPRILMVVYTAVIASLLPAFFALSLFNKPLASLALTGFVYGAWLSGFVANLLVMATVRR